MMLTAVNKEENKFYFKDLILIDFLVFKRHFQQYFSYIMATSGGRVPGENHRPWVNNW
jgi:hypothetical protein